MNVRTALANVLMLAGALLASGCADTFHEPAGHTASSGRNAGRRPSFAQAAPRLPAGMVATSPVLDTEAGLDASVQYALLHNPGLQAAYERWQAAQQKAPQVRALPDPQLGVGYSTAEFDRQGDSQVTVSQTLPWFGKLDLQGRMAWEEAEAARERYEAERLRLAADVADAYYEYYYVCRSADAVRDMRDLVKYLAEVTRTRYEVSASGHPDVIRTQVELAELEDRLRTAEDVRAPAAARLNAVLNRPVLAEFPPAQAPPAEMLDATEEQVLEWGLDGNPDVRAFEHEILREQHAVGLARKQYNPDLTLGVGVMDMGRSDRGMMRQEDRAMFMASVNLPLWRGKLAAGVREAEARERSAGNMLAERRNALAAAIRLTLFNLRDAGRKVDLYRDTLLPMARQSLKANQTAFEAGKAGLSDVLDSERVLLEFELSYERALADRAQRLARLEMLAGRELPRAGGGNRPDTGTSPPAQSTLAPPATSPPRLAVGSQAQEGATR